MGGKKMIFLKNYLKLLFESIYFVFEALHKSIYFNG